MGTDDEDIEHGEHLLTAEVISTPAVSGGTQSARRLLIDTFGSRLQSLQAA
jgi:hypothetical protein